MMESQQWPVKYEQSAATGLETTDDGLNNGNDTKTEAASKDDPDGTPPNDPGGHPAVPTISEKAKQLIPIILEQMKALSNAEKYLLYLKLFQLSNVVDPLRQPLNPLGSRSEINRTISWIKTHLEEDMEISLPKQQVYEEYSDYCTDNQIKSLSQADFGKVMKQVYPKVRARRLGTRGNSRYCYSGLRRCVKLKAPELPDLADKPLSTEAPYSHSSLTAAAWLIVKEWSELHFGCQFQSLQALARFLVINHSVGRGTDAANQLTSATESQLKGDPQGGKKHREMQLQLQKKIQQKNEVKERKRKIQSPKCEQKLSSGKKAKGAPRAEPSPTVVVGGENSTGSTCTSPTQGKPICDKSLDFTTQVPTLPDFKSFQKPACEQGSPTPAKVPIPRLAGTSAGSAGKQQQQQQQQLLHKSPQPSPKRGGGAAGGGSSGAAKGAKYKAIQPKPQPCDIASYNPQQQPTAAVAADIRSQGVHNVDKFKEKKSSDEDCDAPVFSLPRERLDSISNVDKDAMDEYLGTSNSQHEEELSKYFSNNIAESIDADTTDNKLSQLRQLLEQNGISDNKSLMLVANDQATTAVTEDSALPVDAAVLDQLVPLDTVATAVVSTTHARGMQGVISGIISGGGAMVTAQPVPGNARRRVSFETLPSQQPPQQQQQVIHDVITVVGGGNIVADIPASPNTRRKNFSFTPISPGPQSPGRQSKCSSTNVSPFVSPRNTPVPRTKNNAHQNAGIMNGGGGGSGGGGGCCRKQQQPPQQQYLSNGKAIKREPDLMLDIPDSSSTSTSVKSFMAMSAPASPMLGAGAGSKSVLQKLLNASGKVPYSPDYVSGAGATSKRDFSNEISLLLDSDQQAVTMSNNFVEMFRSSSRSQSVPLHQMSTKFCDISGSSDGGQYLAQSTTDFADFDPIPEAESANVDRIINSLDEPPTGDMYEGETGAATLPAFSLIVNNNLEHLEQSAFQDLGATFSSSGHVPASRNLGRSQSIDVNSCYDMKCGGSGNPSRSVPSTPLPFLSKHMPITGGLKSFGSTGGGGGNHSSRSYPSTPLLVTESPFDYTLNSDCLLNGQPIRTNGGAAGAAAGSGVQSTNLNAYFMPNLGEISDDNNIDRHLEVQEDEFRSLPNSNDYVMVENDNALMDENGVLIGNQSYNGN